MSTRPAGLAVVVLASALLLAGCGGEELPYDDGSYSSVTAGNLARLAAAGVSVTSIDLPTSAAPDAVLDRLVGTDALGGQLVDVEQDLPAAIDDQLALDPAEVDGLQATITDISPGGAGAGGSGRGTPRDGRLVVLVLDDAAAAIELAASDPEVFAAGPVETDRSSYVAGNVVAYYSPAGAMVDRTDDVADLMTSLTGL